MCWKLKLSELCPCAKSTLSLFLNRISSCLTLDASPTPSLASRGGMVTNIMDSYLSCLFLIQVGAKSVAGRSFVAIGLRVLRAPSCPTLVSTHRLRWTLEKYPFFGVKTRASTNLLFFDASTYASREQSHTSQGPEQLT